jgi:hypothetical protein
VTLDVRPRCRRPFVVRRGGNLLSRRGLFGLAGDRGRSAGLAASGEKVCEPPAGAGEPGKVPGAWSAGAGERGKMLREPSAGAGRR